ncbi:MAG: phosphoribosylformylglycinamidine synthase subunit PurQ [Candidatus Obscuribacterales bacterium]|nr:phosphoribosylformylglycinamidine synthase subunit PurQ [Candidatus Obscuribacterales bacterium]
MAEANALVLHGDGINCQEETSFALELSGFTVQNTHVFELLENPEQLKSVQLLAIPGGFSFGDEIASGKVLAVKIKNRMQSILQDYIDHGRLVLGICNGFQVLVQLGLLPNSNENGKRLVSLNKNVQGHFINRWTSLDVSESKASETFFHGLKTMELPVRHGEGNLQLEATSMAQTASTASQQDVLRKSQAFAQAAVKEAGALRYVEDINGSFDRIAALTNSSGTVLGLMPHPEAFVRTSQHPNWTSKNWRKKQIDSGNEIPCGLRLLQNAHNFIQRAF